jgi:hypothetical protein
LDSPGIEKYTEEQFEALDTMSSNPVIFSLQYRKTLLALGCPQVCNFRQKNPFCATTEFLAIG